MRPGRGAASARAPASDVAANDRGAVTVEAAIALCALIAVVAFALAGIAAVADQLRCTDAAREAARLIARGEPFAADTAVDRIAPEGAELSVRTEDDRISVSVAADAASGLLPGIRLIGEAYAVAEPGVGAGTPPSSGGEPNGHR